MENADIWLIPNTEENRKTALWGTASIKNAEQEKEYSVEIPKNPGYMYLLQMIVVRHIYYDSKAIRLGDGYSLLLYRDKENEDVRLVIYDEAGEKISDESVFNAVL